MIDKDCLHCLHLSHVEMIDGVPVVYCDIPNDKCSYSESERAIVIAHGGKDLVGRKEERDRVIQETVDDINREN